MPPNLPLKLSLAVAINWGSPWAVAGEPATRLRGSESSDAAEHIEKGIELRRQNRDQEALLEFQKAEELSPSRKANAQIGLAQMALGKFAAAERTLEQALSHSDTDPWILEHRRALEEALDRIRGHLGTLKVFGQPRGAAVNVDGSAACSIPCSIHVQAGEVAVRITSPGYVPILRTVTVEAGQITSQDFTLVTSTHAEEAAPTSGISDRAISGTRAASPWPWLAGAGSLISLTIGSIETIRWSNKASEFNGKRDGNGNLLCGASDPSNGDPGCSDLLDQGRRARIAAVGGLTLGIGLGITALILFTSGHSADEEATALHCGPGGPSLPMVCAMTF